MSDDTEHREQRAENREQIREGLEVAAEGAASTADDWRAAQDARYRRVTKLVMASLAMGIVTFLLGGWWLGHQQGTITGQQNALALQQLETARLVKANARNIKTIARLREKGVDESCKRAEQQEKIATLQIIRTYAFLVDLSPQAAGDAIIQAAIKQLPVTYREAEAARAPAYCNVPGVGLPEPKSPKLPKKRSFHYLLRR